MAIRERFEVLRNHLNQMVLGQEKLVDSILLALLADGHLLVEGAPGLAKTRAISALSAGIEGDFHRIQFTPDLLPSDVTGTEIYRPQDASFSFQKGPIFHNLILADEINRAPAKVQSALLEAMAERQVTVGHETFKLPELFLVMATQNPIEQEGTYPLPEAQLDRFLMHVKVDYPDGDVEKNILRLTRGEAAKTPLQSIDRISQTDVFAIRQQVLELHMADDIEEYIVQLILATRRAANYDENLGRWIEFGASPRGTIALDRCARANAWLNDRDFVSPQDVQDVIFNCLRHRILLSYEAEADGIDVDKVIEQILNLVAVP